MLPDHVLIPNTGSRTLAHSGPIDGFVDDQRSQRLNQILDLCDDLLENREPQASNLFEKDRLLQRCDRISLNLASVPQRAWQFDVRDVDNDRIGRWSEIGCKATNYNIGRLLVVRIVR